MDGADFSDTDWYNAFSFDVRPLTQTQRRALNECPIGIEYFIKEFDGDYAISFERSSLRFQQQTTSRWNEVSRPGSDCDLVKQAHQTDERPDARRAAVRYRHRTRKIEHRRAAAPGRLMVMGGQGTGP